MREIADCSGGTRRAAPAGTESIHEERQHRHVCVSVLIEGRIEVVRGDTVGGSHHRPAPCSAKCRCCLSCRTRRPCISVIYEFDDAAAFLRDRRWRS